MIFVTAGTEHGFDRLFRCVDDLVERGDLPGEVFGQTGYGKYTPTAFETTSFLSRSDFRHRLERARLLICHVGIGTILLAVERGIRVVAMPRRAELGEHVNDHQVDSAHALEREGMALIAWNENELLDRVREAASWQPRARPVDTALVDAVERDLRGLARMRRRRRSS